MNAVTRKEKILDGQDLTPVTRKEYFLKKAVSEGGGGGLLVNLGRDGGVFTIDSTYDDILSAINSGANVTMMATSSRGTIYLNPLMIAEYTLIFTCVQPVFEQQSLKAISVLYVEIAPDNTITAFEGGHDFITQ